MAQRARATSAHHLWRLVLVPLPFLMMLPFLIDPTFSLVDDGVSLQTAMRMDIDKMSKKPDGSGERHSRHWYVEEHRGRVRPVYWWWLWLNYKLYGFNCHAWHIGLGVSIALILQLAYELSYRATGSVLASVVAGGLVVAFHPYAAIFTRLGLGEVPMLLLIGVSVLCMMRGWSLGPRVPGGKQALLWLWFGLAVVTLGLAYFVKETSLVMLPTSVVMLLALWRRESDAASKVFLVGYVLANVAAAVALLSYVVPAMKLPPPGEAPKYSHLYLYYKLGWMLDSVSSYLRYVARAWSALPVLALAAMGVKLARSWRAGRLADEQRWQLVWLTCAAASLLVIAPWGGSDERIARYLLPFTMFAAIFIGWEVIWLVQSTRRLLAGYAKAPGKYELQRLTLRSVLVLVVALGVLAMMNFPFAYKGVLDAWRIEAVSGNLLRGLAARAPQGRPLYARLVVEEQEELRYGMRLHLGMIYGREDFNKDRLVKYFGPPGDPAVREGYVGLPEAGEWVLVPWSVGRQRGQLNVAALSQLLKATQMFVVTEHGWEVMPNSSVLMQKLSRLKEAWVVLETGEAIDFSDDTEGGAS